MNPLTQSKNATILPLLIALTLGCFGLSPLAALARLEENLGAAEVGLSSDDLREIEEAAAMMGR